MTGNACHAELSCVIPCMQRARRKKLWSDLGGLLDAPSSKRSKRTRRCRTNHVSAQGWLGSGSKGDRSRLCLFPQAIEARPCRVVLPVKHQSPNCRCMKQYASTCEMVWKCNVENVHRRGRKSRDPLETNTRPSKSGESSGVCSNLPSALPRNSAAKSRRGDGQTCRGRV